MSSSYTTLVRMIFGSRLYGTATEQSDQDFKGVFLPTVNQVLTLDVPKAIEHRTKQDLRAKNTAEDIDDVAYSLHYFLQLACSGETVALDMLHASDSHILEKTEVWESLVANRTRFYTKNLKAFVSYAKRQAAKYGVKGSRLADTRVALQLLKLHPEQRIEDIWDQLPISEHMSKWYEDGHGVISERPLVDGKPYCWYVCGKKLMLRTFCRHYVTLLETFIQEYGHRAQQAEQNEGIDWKAVSHAFRAAFQTLHILEDGGYSYPLPETDLICKVKAGALDYRTIVGPMLDQLMDSVVTLTAKSAFPETVDRQWWDHWLIDVLHTAYRIPHDTRTSTTRACE